MKKVLTAAAIAVATISTAAIASVTFNAETGAGFVGKGDVQLLFGYNNKQLQDNAASVKFSYEATSVSEYSWTCTNSKNEQEQIRARKQETSVSGLVASVAREKSQVTGFTLSGYSGTPTVTSSAWGGPALNSCPSGFWSLTTAASDTPTVTNLGGGLFVESADRAKTLLQ